MANDCILNEVGVPEADAMLPAVGGWGSNFDSTLLPFKVLFPFVICPYLVTAHPFDQALALANWERLQQTLVYLHVVTKNVT